MSRTRAGAKPADPRTAAPLMRAPANRLQVGLGAEFAEKWGWELPVSYGDVEDERRRLRETVALADVTPRAKIDVRGRVDATLDGDEDDEHLVRISDTWAMLLLAPGTVGERVAKLQASAGDEAMVTDVTHLFAGYALAGPGLDRALERLTSFDSAGLGAGEGTGAPIADVRAVWLRGALEIPLVEIYVASELGRYAWRSMLQVVTALGGGPVGWDALRAEGWS